MKPATFELEDFSTPDAEPVPNPEFEEGFAAGVEAAKNSYESQAADALVSISSTLSDMEFGFVEAKEHLLGLLRALLADVADRALPELVSQSFGAHFVDVVAGRFDAAASKPIAVAVNPEQQSYLREAAPNGRFEFEADPGLALGQAVLRQESHELFLDLASLTDALQQALRGLEVDERTSQHG